MKLPPPDHKHTALTPPVINSDFSVEIYEDLGAGLRSKVQWRIRLLPTRQTFSGKGYKTEADCKAATEGMFAKRLTDWTEV